jgi:hypothetical protein
MKTITTLVVLGLSISGIAQDYTLFQPNDHKLFGTIEEYAVAGSVMMDSSFLNADTLRLYPAMDMEDIWIPSFDCGWWGGSECLPYYRQRLL